MPNLSSIYWILLDLLERDFVDQANSFSVLFDNKRFQALDLKSMLEPNFAIYPILRRFTRDSLQAAMQIRDFKAVATELIAVCELLSVITELFILPETAVIIVMINTTDECPNEKKNPTLTPSTVGIPYNCLTAMNCTNKYKDALTRHLIKASLYFTC